jgi:hypothetical protein
LNKTSLLCWPHPKREDRGERRPKDIVNHGNNTWYKTEPKIEIGVSHNPCPKFGHIIVCKPQTFKKSPSGVWNHMII